jgi:hypothetical protein
MRMMLWLGIIGVLACTFAPPVAAQQLDLPRLSPGAKVSQVVGLTEISVDYSSPAVRGRVIYGGLVPYGKLWRTGANQATKLTVTKDVLIDRKTVPAGTYALFTIPGKQAWTVIMNKNPNQGGTADYKQELDLLRFQVKPHAAPKREHMTFIFADTTEDSTSLDLEWAGLRVSIPIKAHTAKQVAATLKAIEESGGRPFVMAARYLLDAKKDYDRAMKLVERSLMLKEEWLGLWTKAQLLAAKGKAKSACPVAQKAKALGEKAPFYPLADEVKKALADWKCK